ncbi:MAG: hypothetical protein H7Y15_08495 [Pseudonocardia sp.]|nr:hypothetical protein [Pseudonocardia sp.]
MPTRSPFSARPESTATLLKAFSAELISDRMGDVTIWQLQQRGSGAEAKRRIMLRLGSGVAWPDGPPQGFQPGEPLYSGWWPAATFDKPGGWIRALEQDPMIICNPMTADDFRTRYSKALIRLWRPDTSGGSLASTARSALRQFLLDYPPTRDWAEASSVGMPWLISQSATWLPTDDFAVVVRWLDVGRFVRSNFAVQVTPSVLAEMAELTGAVDAVTPTQEGRWRLLRRDYFDDRTWALILDGARNVALRREDRRGLHVLRGGAADDGASDDGDDLRGVR